MPGTRRLIVFLVALGLAAGGLTPWGRGVSLAENPGQERFIYVPVYSHVFHGDQARPFYLTATVTVRNLDPTATITVVSADYYDSSGKLIRSYGQGPVEVKPLASKHYVVRESDTEGGVGAGFLIAWRAPAEASIPLVEAVMIGARNQQGISIVCRGEVVKR